MKPNKFEIHFTDRELDVVACMLANRSTKKIASLLEVSPRTVESHLRNLYMKLECNSREGIIDYIENSGQYRMYRQHYAQLSIQSAYNDQLKKIKARKTGKNLLLAITSSDDKELKKDIQSLVKALKLAGIKSQVIPSRRKDPQDNWSHELTLVTREEWQLAPKSADATTISHSHTYVRVLTLLSNILTDTQLELTITSLKEKLTEMDSDSMREGTPTLSNNNPIPVSTLTFRSELQLPNPNAMLLRKDKLDEIESLLQDQTGIRSVALIGPGGAGKTVLGRYYTSQQDSPVAWEINAETAETLRQSFESLARHLAASDLDLSALDQFFKIQTIIERDERVMSFIKSRLQANPNWTLLYDNVERFVDIEKVFPQDPTLWGEGTVLLTTRDVNINLNHSIKGSIAINEITAEQKLDLFSRILKIQDRPTNTQEFLSSIPSYPLDVVSAAAFISATSTAFEDYLALLKEQHDGFDSLQADILRESGNYVKTRYSIVTTSIERLISENKDHAKCLLLISLIDSQDIPVAFLEHLTSKVVSTRFIFSLRKYSLITSESITPHPAFSLHRSTQAIMYAYLTEKLKLQGQSDIINDICNALETYITEIVQTEDFPRMQKLLAHYDAFLQHSQLFPPEALSMLRSKLGRIYYNQGYYEQAYSCHQKAQADLPDHGHHKAWNLVLMGHACRSLGKLSDAEDYLLQGRELYEKKLPDHKEDYVRSMLYLAVTYRDQGKCAKALELSNLCLATYNKLNQPDTLLMGEILTYLGQVHGLMGNFSQAHDLCQRSFDIFQNQSLYNPLRESWALTFLGYVQAIEGDYINSRKNLERSLNLCESSRHAVSDNGLFSLASLAKSYFKLQEYDKALATLDKFLNNCQHKALKSNVPWSNHLGDSLKDICDFKPAEAVALKNVEFAKKLHGQNHIAVARFLWCLAEIQQLQGKLIEAETVLQEALEICKQISHSEMHTYLKALSDIELIRATRTEQHDNKEHHRTRAMQYLNRALDVVKQYHAEGSGFIKSYSHDINKLQQNIASLAA